MEYAFEGRVYGEMKYWADAYPRLGDARRAAKNWVNRTPSRTAAILVKEAPQPGDYIGAVWRKVGDVSWTT